MPIAFSGTSKKLLLDFLKTDQQRNSGLLNATTMTNKKIESVVDEVGTEIIINGRLRTVIFKKIFKTRYKVSTISFIKR